MANEGEQGNNSNGALAGAAVYTRPLLSVYDLLVLGSSNSYVWKCPSKLILDFYNQNISDRHLDVGVGTGYFLDKCHYPSTTPTIVLADLNPNSLEVTAKRLNRYQPNKHTLNVLEPINIGESEFDSIGLNYVLHCLPGTMIEKGIAIKNLKPLLSPGGVLFGTTILGKDVERNFLARTLMAVYNRQKIFSNKQDTLADLEHVLQDTFAKVSVRIGGCVAFFVARELKTSYGFF